MVRECCLSTLVLSLAWIDDGEGLGVLTWQGVFTVVEDCEIEKLGLVVVFFVRNEDIGISGLLRETRVRCVKVGLDVQQLGSFSLTVSGRLSGKQLRSLCDSSVNTDICES